MKLSHQTLHQNFFEVAEQYQDKTALRFKKSDYWEDMTFGQLADKIRQAAAGLRSLGVNHGDKVAILSENRPEWAITDFATIGLGAILVPIHTTSSTKNTTFILEHSEAKIAIVSNLDNLDKIGPGNELEKIIFLGESDEGLRQKHSNLISWQELMATQPNSIDTRPTNIISSDDICTIVYTSGTTGQPKGVQLNHGNFINNIEMSHLSLPFGPDDLFLSFLPLSHILERMAGQYKPLLSGSAIAYAESPKALAQNLAEIRPTIMIGVPRIYEKFYEAILAKAPSAGLKKKVFDWAMSQKKGSLGYRIADLLVFKKIRKVFGGQLKDCTSSGAPIDPQIEEFFYQIGILILEGYGLTETSPVLTINKRDNFKFGTVGLPLEGVEIKIAGDQEVLARGKCVMKGYYKDPEETAKAIDADGWFHTGDLGRFDEDGFLILTGRKKELIITSGGKKISPDYLESKMNLLPSIDQSMVIGNNRKFISAIIIPNLEFVRKFALEKSIDSADIKATLGNDAVNSFYQESINAINQELSDEEKIRRFVLITDGFSLENEELTPTLKLRRNIIEQHYQERITSIYHEPYQQP